MLDKPDLNAIYKALYAAVPHHERITFTFMRGSNVLVVDWLPRGSDRAYTMMFSNMYCPHGEVVRKIENTIKCWRTIDAKSG